MRVAYQEQGIGGLNDRRRGRPSPRRAPFKLVEKVLCLYADKYFDFNVKHFHEQLVEQARPVLQLHLDQESAAGSRLCEAQ